VTKKHQVRLDADVAEALGRDAERKGTSLNVAANTWLRRALGLPAMGTQVAHRAPVDPEAPPAKAKLVPAGPTPSTGCRHPVGRRIGPYCAACNTKLAVKPGPTSA
jgi:hypothetical protein